MIVSFLFIILALISEFLVAILGTIPIVIPAQISSALAFFFGYLKYLGGIINFADIIPAMIFYLNFIVAWFTFRLFMWAWHLIPKIGRKDQIHTFKNKTEKK